MKQCPFPNQADTQAATPDAWIQTFGNRRITLMGKLYTYKYIFKFNLKILFGNYCVVSNLRRMLVNIHNLAFIPKLETKKTLARSYDYNMQSPCKFGATSTGVVVLRSNYSIFNR